ncbi:MAG TPA: hypothetical protein PLM75_02100, partial [bacterium]|nr:hypothetical protein [bacterium]
MINITALDSYKSLRIFNTAGKTVAKAMEKLSTGFRINSAADDAAGVSVSEKLTFTLRGIKQSIKNIENAVSVLQVAESGYNTITNLLNRARVLAIQASNDTYTAEDRQNLHEDFWKCIQEIYDVSNKVEYNGKKIFGDPNYAFFKRQPTILNAAPLYTISETFTTPTPTTEQRGTVINQTRSITDRAKLGETEFDTFTPIGYQQTYSPTLTNDNIYNIGSQDAPITLGNSVTPAAIAVKKDDVNSTATAGIYQTQSIASTLNSIYYSETFSRGYGQEITQAVWNVGDTLNIDGAGFLNNSVRVFNKSTSTVLSEWDGITGDYEVDYINGTITIKDTTFIENNNTLRIEYWRAGDDIITTANNFIKDTVKVQYSTDNGTTWTNATFDELIDDTNTITLTNTPIGNLGKITPEQGFLYRATYVKTGTNTIALNETPDTDTIKINIGGSFYSAGSAAFGTNTWKYDSGTNSIIIDPGLLDDGNRSINISYVKKDTNIIALTNMPETYSGAIGVQIGGTTRSAGTAAFGTNTWKYDSDTNSIIIDPGLLDDANTTIKIRYIESGSNTNIYDFGVNPYITDGMSLRVDGGARLVKDTSFEIVGNQINLIGSGRLIVNSSDFSAASPQRTFSLKYFTDSSQYNNIVFTNTPLDIFSADNMKLGSEIVKLNSAALTYNTHYLINNDSAVDLSNGVETAKNIYAGDTIVLEYIDASKIQSKDTASAGPGEIFFNTDINCVQINAQNSFLIDSLIFSGYTAGTDYEFYNSDGVYAEGVIFYQDKLKGNVTGLQLKYLLGHDNEVTLDYTPLDYDADPNLAGSEKISKNGVLLTPGTDYIFTAPNKIKLLGDKILTKSTDVLTMQYLRASNPKGHDNVLGTADDNEDENIFTLTNVDGVVVSNSLKVYVDGVLQTEGVNYNFDNVNNKIIFVNDRTNGLAGRYNQVKIDYQDSANPNKITLSKNIIDYDGDTNNSAAGSELVYIDIDNNGSYTLGTDVELTQGTHYNLANNNTAIQFTNDGLIRIGDYGNPYVNVDYLYYDASYNSIEINLTANLKAQFGNILPNSEKIYADLNYNGILDPATELLTANVDYTLDYNTNTLRFADYLLKGKQKINIQFIQDAKNTAAGGLGYDENTFQLSKTPLNYNGAARVWLNGAELTINSDFIVDYNNNQIILTGAGLVGCYASTNANDATDDTAHTIKVSYIAEDIFEFAKLTGAFTNPSPNPGVAGLINVNAVGTYSGFPGIVWDADSLTFSQYSIKVEVNDGSGWRVITRDENNGWDYIKTAVDNTRYWTNPITGLNYFSAIDLY